MSCSPNPGNAGRAAAGCVSVSASCETAMAGCVSVVAGCVSVWQAVCLCDRLRVCVAGCVSASASLVQLPTITYIKNSVDPSVQP